MGMIANLVRGAGAVTSLGAAAKDLSEVFVPNATAGQALDHAAHRAALDQLAAEYAREARGSFDRIVDGLNRLPRPMMAVGTLGLFAYSMVAPTGFATRMEGLGYVPDPLWWLLGAIVSFYFGARELHYLRAPEPPARPLPEPVQSAWLAPQHTVPPMAPGAETPASAAPPPEEIGQLDTGGPTPQDADNAALSEWLARQQAILTQP